MGTGFNNSVRTIIIQPNGDILVGGQFISYDGNSSERIIRLNSDFTIDTVALGTGFNSTVFAIALQADGKIVAGGQFTRYNGTFARFIIRLNSDFTIDVSGLDHYTITVTYTAPASGTAPTSLTG